MGRTGTYLECLAGLPSAAWRGVAWRGVVRRGVAWPARNPQRTLQLLRIGDQYKNKGDSSEAPEVWSWSEPLGEQRAAPAAAQVHRK